ncbi:MAG: HIT domain-containing protein [Ignavibacteriae bacterium]|nr:HIT domain-containing protein [Ignavibacteriota bacterium]
MKRLFSPWRSAYIRTFKSERKSKRCLFCRIAKEKKDARNLVVWRGKTCFVVMNLFPYNAGHVLIVPYNHTSSLESLSTAEHAEAMRATALCLKALKKLSAPHGFNFGANLGRVAGAGIEHHVHFHVVPRWSGDTNFMSVLSDTKVISEDMQALWSKLSALLVKL